MKATTKARIGLLCTFAAVLLGLVLAIRHFAGTPLQALHAADETQRREIARLRSEQQRLRLEQAHLTATRMATDVPKAADSRSTAQTLRVMTDLQRRELVDLRLPLLDPRTGDLTPTFFELFNCTPEETADVTARWHTARHRMGELAASHATVERSSDGALRIRISPFVEGAATYDELAEAMRAALGAERADAFSVLFAGQISAELHQFGAEERILTLQPDRRVVADSPQYRLRDQRTSFVDATHKQVWADPHRGALRATAMRTTERQLSRIEFVTRYPEIAKLWPENF